MKIGESARPVLDVLGTEVLSSGVLGSEVLGSGRLGRDGPGAVVTLLELSSIVGSFAATGSGGMTVDAGEGGAGISSDGDNSSVGGKRGEGGEVVERCAEGGMAESADLAWVFCSVVSVVSVAMSMAGAIGSVSLAGSNSNFGAMRGGFFFCSQLSDSFGPEATSETGSSIDIRAT